MIVIHSKLKKNLILKIKAYGWDLDKLEEHCKEVYSIFLDILSSGAHTMNFRSELG